MNNKFIITSAFFLLFAILFIRVGLTSAATSPNWSECKIGQSGYNISNCRNRAVSFKQVGGPVGRPDEDWYQWAISEPNSLSVEIACGMAPNANSCKSMAVAAATAPALLFDPATSSVALGQNFTVTVKVDTYGNATTGTDAYIQYDQTAVQFVSLANGDFYPSISHADQQGVLSLRGMVTEPASSKTGTGLLGAVTFKALKEVVTRLVFICDPSKATSSKIIKNDINATNIISCGSNNQITVTVGSATATPTGNPPTTGTATPTGAVTSTPRPSRVPEDCDEDHDGHDDDNDKKIRHNRRNHGYHWDRRDEDYNGLIDDNDERIGTRSADIQRKHDDDCDSRSPTRNPSITKKVTPKHDDDDDDDRSKLKLMIMLVILLFVMLTVVLGL